MKEITIISGKGGTGKTSFIAAFAALSKGSVIADCDVDASNLHIILDPEDVKEEPIIGSFKASIDSKRCDLCGLCREKCRFSAIDEELRIHNELCEGCGVCEFVCPQEAISMNECEAGTLILSNTRFGWLSHVKMKSGEEGSGKLVTAVRKQARAVAGESGAETILVDGPPGIGCPVIASITGSDLAIIVCEPTLSGMHDLKRVNKLASQMKVPVAICINKSDINEEIKRQIEAYCKDMAIPILGEVPYNLDFVTSMVSGKSVVEIDSPIKGHMKGIWSGIIDMLHT